jgi:hypothetical protein
MDIYTRNYDTYIQIHVHNAYNAYNLQLAHTRECSLVWSASDCFSECVTYLDKHEPKDSRIHQRTVVFTKGQSYSPRGSRIHQGAVVFTKGQSYSPRGSRIHQGAVVFTKGQSYSSVWSISGCRYMCKMTAYCDFQKMETFATVFNNFQLVLKTVGKR